MSVLQPARENRAPDIVSKTRDLTYEGSATSDNHVTSGDIIEVPSLEELDSGWGMNAG